jgi:hypothetical protein
MQMREYMNLEIHGCREFAIRKDAQWHCLHIFTSTQHSHILTPLYHPGAQAFQMFGMYLAVYQVVFARLAQAYQRCF